MDTNIIVVLDASGSMGAVADATLSGLNEYLDSRKQDQTENDGKITVSLYQFRTEGYGAAPGSDWVFRNRPAAELVPMTKDDYRPTGGTPLYDAIKTVIIEASKTACCHNRTLVVIVTDGEENSSKNATRGEILELITSKSNENFSFVYLGANQDSFKAAGGIGIAHQNIGNYAVLNMDSAFRSVSRATSTYTSSVQLSNKAVLVDEVDANGDLKVRPIISVVNQ